MSAPEFLPSDKQLREYDERVDCWSLACIVYNMYTGVPPFIDASRMQLMQKIREANWKQTCPNPDYLKSDDGTDLKMTKDTKRCSI